MKRKQLLIIHNTIWIVGLIAFQFWHGWDFYLFMLCVAIYSIADRLAVYFFTPSKSKWEYMVREYHQLCEELNDNKKEIITWLSELQPELNDSKNEFMEWTARSVDGASELEERILLIKKLLRKD